MLPPGSSKVWVLKRKHTKADFLSFYLGVPHHRRRALCGRQDPAVAVYGGISNQANFITHFVFASLCCLRSHLYFSLAPCFMADAALFDVYTFICVNQSELFRSSACMCICRYIPYVRACVLMAVTEAHIV